MSFVFWWPAREAGLYVVPESSFAGDVIPSCTIATVLPLNAISVQTAQVLFAIDGGLVLTQGSPALKRKQSSLVGPCLEPPAKKKESSNSEGSARHKM